MHRGALLRACYAYANGVARVGQELAPLSSPAANPVQDPANTPAADSPAADAVANEAAEGASGAAEAGGDAGITGEAAAEPTTSEGFRLVLRQVLPRLEAALLAL